MGAAHYGWAAGIDSFVKSLRVQDMTVCQLLNQITSSNLCHGMKEGGQPHIITKPGDLHGPTTVPLVSVVANRQVPNSLFSSSPPRVLYYTSVCTTVKKSGFNHLGGQLHQFCLLLLH